MAEEYVQVARAIEKADMQRQLGPANDLSDSELFLERATKGLLISAEVRDAFLQKYKPLTFAGGALVHEGGKVQFRKAYWKESEVHALFRLLDGQGNLDYCDLILAKDSKGTVRAVDMEFCLRGVYCSELYRQALIAAAANADKTIVQKLPAADRDYLEHAAELKQLHVHFRNKDGAAAEGVLEGLPESLRSQRQYALLRILAASMNSNRAPESQAIADYRKQYPNDLSLPVLLVRIYAARTDRDSADRELDVLKRETGDDAALLCLHARYALMLHRPETNAQAEAYAREAVAKDPDLPDARIWLFSSLADEGKWDESVAELAKFEAKYHQRYPLIDSDPHYAALAASEAYKAYRAKTPNP